MPAAKFEITRRCKVCGETFVAKTIESWYCSSKCSKIAWKRRKDEEQRLQRLLMKRKRKPQKPLNWIYCQQIINLDDLNNQYIKI